MNNRWKWNQVRKVARRRARVAKRQAMTRQWVHRCIQHGGKPRSKTVFTMPRRQGMAAQRHGLGWLMSKVRRQSGKQPLARQKVVA